jgi:hypothetical protein
MNKIKLTIILTLFAALCTAAYGQVTVGSSQPPVEGALLDLKDETQPKVPGGATASKGLLMPRVKLSNKNQLYPMYESDGNGGYQIGIVKYTKAAEDKKHIGLIVYNVDDTNGLDLGVHSWDGDQWVAVKSGSGTTYSGEYPIVVENGNIYLATKKTDGSTTLATGSILRFDGAAWEVVVPVDNDTQYTGSASIDVDASTNVISVKDNGVTTDKIKDLNVTPAKIKGGTDGYVLTSNATGGAVWAELKSSGGTQPSIPSGPVVLEAGSGPWLVYYNAASNIYNDIFNFSGTAFVMCYTFNNSASTGTNVESSTWMGVVKDENFKPRVDKLREYYVIYPATELTVKYLGGAVPWYLFHM